MRVKNSAWKPSQRSLSAPRDLANKSRAVRGFLSPVLSGLRSGGITLNNNKAEIRLYYRNFLPFA